MKKSSILILLSLIILVSSRVLAIKYNENTSKNNLRIEYSNSFLEKKDNLYYLYRGGNLLGTYDYFEFIPNSNVDLFKVDSKNPTIINDLGQIIYRGPIDLKAENTYRLYGDKLFEYNFKKGPNINIYSPSGLETKELPLVNNLSQTYLDILGRTQDINSLGLQLNMDFKSLDFHYSRPLEPSLFTYESKDNQQGFGLINTIGDVVLLANSKNPFEDTVYSLELYGDLVLIREEILSRPNYKRVYVFNKTGDFLFKEENILDYKIYNQGTFDILGLETRDGVFILNKNGQLLYSYRGEDIFLNNLNNSSHILLVVSNSSKFLEGVIINGEGKLVFKDNSVKKVLEKFDSLEIPSKDLKLTLNAGQLDSKPILDNNSSYIPLRDLISKLGGTTQWNSLTGETSVFINQLTIKLRDSRVRVYLDGHLVKDFDSDMKNIKGTSLIKISDFKDLLSLDLDFKDGVLHMKTAGV